MVKVYLTPTPAGSPVRDKTMSKHDIYRISGLTCVSPDSEYDRLPFTEARMAAFVASARDSLGASIKTGYGPAAKDLVAVAKKRGYVAWEVYSEFDYDYLVTIGRKS